MRKVYARVCVSVVRFVRPLGGRLRSVRFSSADERRLRLVSLLPTGGPWKLCLCICVLCHEKRLGVHFSCLCFRSCCFFFFFSDAFFRNGGFGRFAFGCGSEIILTRSETNGTAEAIVVVVVVVVVVAVVEAEIVFSSVKLLLGDRSALEWSLSLTTLCTGH